MENFSFVQNVVKVHLNSNKCFRAFWKTSAGIERSCKLCRKRENCIRLSFIDVYVF